MDCIGVTESKGLLKSLGDDLKSVKDFEKFKLTNKNKIRNNLVISDLVNNLYEGLESDDPFNAKTVIFEFITECILSRYSIRQMASMTGIPGRLWEKWLDEYYSWKQGLHSNQLRAIKEFDKTITSIDLMIGDFYRYLALARTYIQKVYEGAALTDTEKYIVSRMHKISAGIANLEIAKQELYTRSGLNNKIDQHFHKGGKSKYETDADEFTSGIKDLVENADFTIKDIESMKGTLLERYKGELEKF